MDMLLLCNYKTVKKLKPSIELATSHYRWVHDYSSSHTVVQ